MSRPYAPSMLIALLGALAAPAAGQGPHSPEPCCPRPVMGDLHRMLPPGGNAFSDYLVDPRGRTLAGDLDADGDVDLVSAGRLLLGDGAGYFSEASPNPLAGTPDGAKVLGDVDGDGDLDLVIVEYVGPAHLYVNDGAGGFEESANAFLPAALHATDLALGDVDGDGALDLWVACADYFESWTEHQDHLYLNDGSGRFVDATAARLPIESSKTDGVVLEDLDGDGDLDAFLGNMADQSMLLANDGAGFFSDVTSTHVPPEASVVRDVVAGDVDGDGDLDLWLGVGEPWIWGPPQEVQDLLFLNDGAGRFTDATASHLPLDETRTEIDAVALGDVDGDGDLDALVGHLMPSYWGPTGALTSLYVNDGAGTFAPAVSLFEPGVGQTICTLLVDVDGDQDLDAFLGRSGWDDRLGLNDGAGVFTDVTDSDLPVDVRGPAADLADVDGDGDLDVLVGSHQGRNHLLLGDGRGAFTDASDTHLPAAYMDTSGIALGDVDGDGDPDALLANSGEDTLYLNDGAGVFTEDTSGRLPSHPASSTAPELIDVDGDADLDAIVAGFSDVHLYLNDGAGFFTDVSTTHLGVPHDSWRALGTGDVDGDGDPDLVLGGWALGEFLYLNDGAGVFTDATAQLPPSPGGWPLEDIAMGDLDADGDLDLVLGRFKGGNLYLNDGSGVFADATATHLPKKTVTWRVAVADLDGDGHVDLLTTAEILFGDGSGALARDGARTAALPGSALLVADLDADGDPDVHSGHHSFANLTRQLASRATPRIGRELTLDLYGPSGAGWTLSVATGVVAPGGAAGIWGLVASGRLDTTGRCSYVEAIPDNPVLVGTSWTWRARIGGASSNLEVTTFSDL